LLSTSSDKVDLIDIKDARLAMRAEIANQGIILAGGTTLAWFHFYHGLGKI